MNKLENEIIVNVIYDGYKCLVQCVEEVVKVIQAALKEIQHDIDLGNIHKVSFKTEIWDDPNMQEFIKQIKRSM